MTQHPEGKATRLQQGDVQPVKVSLKVKALVFLSVMILAVGASLSWYFLRQAQGILTDELQRLVAENFPAADLTRQGITGHSMGGHGALTLHLKHPQRYRTVSAFSPIVASCWERGAPPLHTAPTSARARHPGRTHARSAGGRRPQRLPAHEPRREP